MALLFLFSSTSSFFLCFSFFFSFLSFSFFFWFCSAGAVALQAARARQAVVQTSKTHSCHDLSSHQISLEAQVQTLRPQGRPVSSLSEERPPSLMTILGPKAAGQVYRHVWAKSQSVGIQEPQGDGQTGSTTPPSRHQKVQKPDYCPEKGHVSPSIPTGEHVSMSNVHLTRHKGTCRQAKPRASCGHLPLAGLPGPWTGKARVGGLEGDWAASVLTCSWSSAGAGLITLQVVSGACHCLRSCRCCCHWRAGATTLVGGGTTGEDTATAGSQAHLASWQSASRTHPGGGEGGKSCP